MTWRPPYRAPGGGLWHSTHACRSGTTGIGAAITAVALAWITLDEREQATKLHYFRADMTYGELLRKALRVAASEYDLGMAGSDYADAMGRTWA